MVGREDALEEQAELLNDPDAAVRYWAAVGLQASARSSKQSREALTSALEDPAPVVRVASAAALAGHFREKPEPEPGEEEVAEEPSGGVEEEDPGAEDLERALSVLGQELKSDDPAVALLACRSIELLGERARPLAVAMKQAAARSQDSDSDLALFIRFSAEAFLTRLGR
jgi:HEAT repeat protein